MNARPRWRRIPKLTVRTRYPNRSGGWSRWHSTELRNCYVRAYEDAPNDWVVLYEGGDHFLKDPERWYKHAGAHHTVKGEHVLDSHVDGGSWASLREAKASVEDSIARGLPGTSVAHRNKYWHTSIRSGKPVTS